MSRDQNVAFLRPAGEERTPSAGSRRRVPDPRQPGAEKERYILVASTVQIVLEQVLQREARQNLRLRQGGGQHAGDDDDRGVNKGSVGSCRVAVGAAIRGFTLFPTGNHGDPGGSGCWPSAG